MVNDIRKSVISICVYFGKCLNVDNEVITGGSGSLLCFEVPI